MMKRPAMDKRNLRLSLPLLAVIALLICVAIGGYVLVNVRQSVGDLQEEVGRFQAVGSVGETVIEFPAEEAVQEANRLPGVRLPENADNLHLARQGSVQPTYWLRFDASPDALADFLATTCLTTLEQGMMPPFAYDENADIIANLDWWTPQDATHYMGGQCQFRENVTFSVLVDESDATRSTVYLEIVTG
jgi:hypothetical protein